MQQYLLIRTITEEFEYDRNGILHQRMDDFKRFCFERQEQRKVFGQSKLTRTQLEDEFLMDLFELHNGSMFGDNLFSSTASDDFGIELVTRRDDE